MRNKRHKIGFEIDHKDYNSFLVIEDGIID